MRAAGVNRHENPSFEPSATGRSQDGSLRKAERPAAERNQGRATDLGQAGATSKNPQSMLSKRSRSKVALCLLHGEAGVVRGRGIRVFTVTAAW